MGWFSSMCSWVGNAARTVTRSVTNVVSSVGSTIKKGWEAVKSVGKSIYSGVKTAVKYVKKGYEYVSNKIDQAKKWFWNSSLGKGLISAKNYIMDKTPLGTAIKWGRAKIQQASNWFFE